MLPEALKMLPEALEMLLEVKNQELPEAILRCRKYWKSYGQEHSFCHKAFSFDLTSVGRHHHGDSK